MYELSEKSKLKLKGGHPDLQLFIKELIKVCPIDFGVSHVYRRPEEQFELFKKGRKKQNGIWMITNKKKVVTYCDGFKKSSKHNKSPAEAVDVYAWIGKASWDANHLSVIMGAGMVVAQQLYNEGRISRKIRNGGDWNQNGVLVTMDENERLMDLPHFELI